MFKRYCLANSDTGLYYAKIIRACKLEAAHFSFWILKGHHYKRNIKPIFSGSKINEMVCLDKVTLRRYFQQSVYSLWHLHWLSAVCQFRKVNFLKHSDVKPSCGARATSDRHILELMKFRDVIWHRKSLCSDKAILQIVKLLKMVLCSFCGGIPLKFKKKNGRASSLSAWIIWV